MQPPEAFAKSKGAGFFSPQTSEVSARNLIHLPLISR